MVKIKLINGLWCVMGRLGIVAASFKLRHQAESWARFGVQFRLEDRYGK